MPKYAVYINYVQPGYLEVEADNEDEAKELAYEQAEDAETTGNDDYEITDIEELED